MPNEKGNRYAIHALKDRRATMAGEIVQMKEGISYREEQLTHLDAVLRELDPSYRADTLPPKRLRRVKLFGNGELNRLIATRSGGLKSPWRATTLPTRFVRPGLRAGVIYALTRRVRANLSYLLRNKRVVKTGDRLTAR